MRSAAFERMPQRALETFVEFVGDLAGGVDFVDDDVELVEDGEGFVFLPAIYLSKKGDY